MSQRFKRQSSRTDDGPVPTKRRKGRPPGGGGSSKISSAHQTQDDEEATSSPMDSVHSSRGGSSYSDLKSMNSIYNRNTNEAPAELFRKDLISAMKLPDSEPLKSDEFWVISDQWKQEWERGVQVPVNPDSLPGPQVTVVSTLNSTRYPNNYNEPFKL
ncbi:protein Jade-1-like [Diaphorina citri]|uniref:Protein Jade-1-like n=1 Tax=Diaphorina citri TaxID=121845 RepID=A0A3Q0J9S4_DIACI|nr:protein Jade-1-like [Diaphorina citri]